MKRLVTLAAALGVAVGANAADESEFKNSGEFRLRYHNVMNPSALDNAKAQGELGDTAAFIHRFKWNVTARKGENLQASVGLIHNAMWGDDATTANGIQSVPRGIGDSQNMILVNRAWGWWKATDMLSFKFGRLGLEIADGAVFSENDWEAVPTSHEGVIGMWDMEFAKVSAFGLKSNEYVAFGTTDANALSSDPERNLYGVSLDFKNMPEMIKLANFHFVQDIQDEAGTNPRAMNAQRFGLTVGGDTAGILYKATLAYVTGKSKDRVPTPVTTPSIDISSSMYDLMVGYSMPDVMGLKVTAGYHYDTGDKASTATKNESYDAFFYAKHAYAGLMDVVRWGNLNYWNINASMMPMETLEAGIGFYMFSRTTADAATNFGDRYPNLAGAIAGVTNTEKDIGSELDVYADKTYEGGFKIGARYSMFMPGKGLENPTPKRDETMHEWFLQASMEF